MSIFTLSSCSRNYYKYLSANSFLKNGWYVFNDFKYQGGMKDGKPNGKGTLVYANRTTIEGVFKDGVLNSDDANFDIPNLGVIKSQVVNGDQVSGEINYTNGNYYQGVLTANRPNGEGMLRKSNGDIVAGNFKNGNLDGLGIEYNSSTGEKSIGNFKQGRADGVVAKIDKNDKIDGKSYKNGADKTNPVEYAIEKIKEIEKIEIDVYKEEAKTIDSRISRREERTSQQEKDFRSIEKICNIVQQGFALEVIPNPPRNMNMYNWRGYFDTDEGSLWVILPSRSTESEVRAALLEMKAAKDKQKEKNKDIRKECEIWRKDPANYQGNLETLYNGYSLKDMESNKQYTEKLYEKSRKIDEEIKQKIREQELVREQRLQKKREEYNQQLLEDAQKMRNEFEERCARKKYCYCRVGWIVNCSKGKGACANCQ